MIYGTVKRVLAALVELFVGEVETDIEIDLHFQTCDVSSARMPSEVNLKDEELVIMSFFISEVCELPEKTTVINNINGLLATMKPDALLLYNDSDAYSFYMFLNNRIRSARKFDQIIDINAEYKTETPNYDGVVEEYVDQYDYRPKLSSKAVTKLLRRAK